jgi:ATP-dependent RNA helicase DHX57
MVKKGKEKATAPPPQASASSSKKPAKPSKKPPEEDDFIVFTNSTTDSKPKRGGQGASRGKAPEGEEILTGPPKPTVKQIIGGSSWTGKLPVNLLSEHCQRQKWDRPDYQPVSDVANMTICT